MAKQAKAIAKMQRIAPRKARLVVDQIRHKTIQDALVNLRLIDKKSSLIVEKILKSAIANAENNHEMNVENLYVREAYVNEGPTLKRFRPRAQGRASSIFKRTSHITVVLEEKVKKEVKAVDTKAESKEA